MVVIYFSYNNHAISMQEILILCQPLPASFLIFYYFEKLMLCILINSHNIDAGK